MFTGALQALRKRGTGLPAWTRLTAGCRRRFPRTVLFRSLFTANIFLCDEMMVDLELLQQLFAFLKENFYGSPCEIRERTVVSKNLVSSFKEVCPQLCHMSLGATNEEGVEGSARRDGSDISFYLSKHRAGWQRSVTHQGNSRRQHTFSLSLFPSHSLYAKAAKGLE